MTRHMRPSVLVVDDEEQWRRNFDMQMSEAGYVVGTCGGEDDKESAALGLLESQRFDVVIIDVRLYHPLDDDDVSGLHLAERIRRAFPSIGIIIKTAYTVEAKLTDWIARHHALLEHTADTYLTREPGDDLLRVVADLFKVKVRTNFDLRIEEDGLTLGQIAEAFEERLPVDSVLSEELELLLRRLYFDPSMPPKKIHLSPLTQGLSKSPVFLVTPEAGIGELESEVVKVDEVARNERELRNFHSFVKGRIRGRRAPHEERLAVTSRLGGFALTNLGIEVGGLEEFGDFYKRQRYADMGAIENAISDFFEETCALWYRSTKLRRRTTISWIEDEFPEWRRWFADGIALAAPNMHDQNRITYAESGQSFLNPVTALEKKKLERSYEEVVTHGDINARNLLVDKHNSTWMIDFYKTGPSHILRDLTRLETTLLFELIDTTDLASLIELSRAIAASTDLGGDIVLPAPLNDDVEFCAVAAAVSQVRQLAAKAIGLSRGYRDYFAICACYALRFASFRERVTQTRRKHAVAYAALLLEEIK